MRIFNEMKTEELFNVDESKGKIKEDVIVTHHDAIEGTRGKSHYEVTKVYPNGARDLKEIWDEKPIEGREAWDEYENILVYVPYTQSELIKQEIDNLKRMLSDTDYQAIKFAEGAMSAEEFASTKSKRIGWRAEINKLEAQLAELTK